MTPISGHPHCGSFQEFLGISATIPHVSCSCGTNHGSVGDRDVHRSQAADSLHWLLLIYRCIESPTDRLFHMNHLTCVPMMSMAALHHVQQSQGSPSHVKGTSVIMCMLAGRHVHTHVRAQPVSDVQDVLFLCPAGAAGGGPAPD